MELKFLKIKTEKHPTTNTQLEYLDHHSAVAVLILNSKESKTLLVKQYRPGNRGELYEIPAGLIDENENPLNAMYREVEEETGYNKNSFIEIYKAECPLLISPGYTTENLSFFILKLKDDDIIPDEKKLDEGEDLTTHWIDLTKAKSMTKDLKTHYALNLYELIKKRDK